MILGDYPCNLSTRWTICKGILGVRRYPAPTRGSTSRCSLARSLVSSPPCDPHADAASADERAHRLGAQRPCADRASADRPARHRVRGRAPWPCCGVVPSRSPPCRPSYAAGWLTLAAAYLTGRAAAPEVYTPGIAVPVVDRHWTWAFWCLVYFGVLTAARLWVMGVPGPPRPGGNGETPRAGGCEPATSGPPRARRGRPRGPAAAGRHRRARRPARVPVRRRRRRTAGRVNGRAPSSKSDSPRLAARRHRRPHEASNA